MIPRRRNEISPRASLPLAEGIEASLTDRAPSGLRSWLLALPAAAIYAPIVEATGAIRRVLGQSPLFDASGGRWRAWYALVDVPEVQDGRGPVVVSNAPDTFDPVPGYPPDFQARDLSHPREVAKIRRIAADLDAERMLMPNQDPTAGAPVVWRDRDGTGYVLAGNGRTIALLMAGPDTLADYYAAIPRVWPSAASAHPIPGYRLMVVRIVESADGRPLSLADAVRLAGASQVSTAGIESKQGAAASTVRALGVDPRALPPFTIREALTADNVIDFTRANPALWSFILSRVDPAKRSGYGDPDRALELLRAVFRGAVPAGLQGSLGSEAEEEALDALLPFAVSIETQISAGTLPRSWSFLDALPGAKAVAVMLRKRRARPARIPELIEEDASQTRLMGANTALSDTSLLAIMLGAVLSNAQDRSDPTEVVGQYIAPVVEAGYAAHTAQSGMFGAPQVPNPGRLLAQLMRIRLPARLPSGIRENPRRRNMASRPFLASLERGGEFLIAAPLPEWAALMERAGWVKGTPRDLPSGRAVGLRITRRGREHLRAVREDEDRRTQGAQGSFFA